MAKVTRESAIYFLRRSEIYQDKLIGSLFAGFGARMIPSRQLAREALAQETAPTGDDDRFHWVSMVAELVRQVCGCLSFSSPQHTAPVN